MKRHHKPQPPRSPRLFTEPEGSAEHAQGAYTAQIDGASRGNPGPASYAVLIRRPNGEVLDQLKKEIGRGTNNVAEYYALIAALDYAQTHHLRKLRVRSDSELLVRQMKGHYRVKSFALRQLHERARKLAGSLDYFAIEHVPREQNREADRLAHEALDRAVAARAAPVAEPETSGRNSPRRKPYPGALAPRRAPSRRAARSCRRHRRRNHNPQA